MARCEDFPCCGHDICPDYNSDGVQVNMRCTCGASVPLNSRYSLCHWCLFESDGEWERWDDEREEGYPDYPEDDY